MNAALANHLWQTTVFALFAALFATACRRNRASVRYWLWFGASVKFLVPFMLLSSLGSQLARVPAATQTAAAEISAAIIQVSEPFGDAWPGGLTLNASRSHSLHWLGLMPFLVWLCGFLAIALIRLRMWRRIKFVVQASTPVQLAGIVAAHGIQPRTTPGVFEPGVVGLWRPILLLPRDIDHFLTPPQLDAVVAHELCHIRRHDNLTAAFQMLVEAVFWFHPLIWWIGARLVEERERACDEDVLRVFREPKPYAEAILNVCRRCVGSPLACVSGVSGSCLRQRVEAIMKGRVGDRLSAGKRLLLCGAAILVVVMPLSLGALKPSRLFAQVPPPAVAGGAPTFEVASIKANRSGEVRVTMAPQPGGRFVATNAPLGAIIRNAYQLQEYGLIGGPRWLQTDRFDIIARASSNAPVGQVRLMLRTLLADRFRLVMHTEMRVLPLYALVTARSSHPPGPQMRPTEADCANAAAPSLALDFPGRRDPDAPCGYIGPGVGGGAKFRGVTMEAFARFLATTVHRPVIDRSGLAGYFDMDLELTAELAPPPPPPGLPDRFDRSSSPSIFTALQEQVGLKLQSSRGPVEVLVIDHVEHPAPD
jgi:uncharacterized protein (TIGR03435 family)